MDRVKSIVAVALCRYKKSILYMRRRAAADGLNLAGSRSRTHQGFLVRLCLLAG